jgi:hypothetical protein
MNSSFISILTDRDAVRAPWASATHPTVCIGVSVAELLGLHSLRTRKGRARDAAARRLGKAFAKLGALNLPPLTPEEIQAEIDAARAERRARHPDSR